MALNWHDIRCLNGSQATGFEELCAQLARAESRPATANFIRKGSPDAGVECFCILPSGSEWGWASQVPPHHGEAPVAATRQVGKDGS